jgi:hypothetical protein
LSPEFAFRQFQIDRIWKTKKRFSRFLQDFCFGCRRSRPVAIGAAVGLYLKDRNRKQGDGPMTDLKKLGLAFWATVGADR